MLSPQNIDFRWENVYFRNDSCFFLRFVIDEIWSFTQNLPLRLYFSVVDLYLNVQVKAGLHGSRRLY